MVSDRQEIRLRLEDLWGYVSDWESLQPWIAVDATYQGFTALPAYLSDL